MAHLYKIPKNLKLASKTKYGLELKQMPCVIILNS
jgi:hypothetical protein